MIEIVLTYLRFLSTWVSTIIASCIIWIPATYLFFQILRMWILIRAKGLLPRLRTPLSDGRKPLLVGFFHPYCNAGGGGERVLWVSIRAIQNRYENVRCVVYTGDTDATKECILQKALQRFKIAAPRPDDVEFVFLKRRMWVEAQPYPIFTLLGQSLGSLVLGFEALMKFVPDVYLDTMGYAFTLPLFKYFGNCRVGCYVHYPTISTDMLERVSQRHHSYNNASFISRSLFLSSLKLIYYRLFAYAYGVAGKRSNVIMVNSSWTYNHILSLWRAHEHTHIVYPPCDVREFLTIPLVRNTESSVYSVVSVAQFRPEKNHQLQLRSFKRFIDGLAADADKQRFRLVLVGSYRNAEDLARIEELKALAKDLEINDLVEFDLNVSFEKLKKHLSEAAVGLHTMWNEHFGIGVVECMAAGTIILAHNSGGPKLDIVTDNGNERVGFLADDEESYSNALKTIFELDKTELSKIRTNARESVKRFSDEEFENKLLHVTEKLFA